MDMVDVNSKRGFEICMLDIVKKFNPISDIILDLSSSIS
jgi:hypothetical protein